MSHSRIFAKADASQYTSEPSLLYTGTIFCWRDILSLLSGGVSRTAKRYARNDLHPAEISLRVYDRQADAIITVLIDVIVDISLYSVT